MYYINLKYKAIYKSNIKLTISGEFPCDIMIEF